MEDRSKIDSIVGSGVAGNDSRPDDKNVDKIREILFGGQMRDYDQRFELLEEKLAQQFQSLQQDVRRDLDALEDFARMEVERLGESQQKEKQERAEALETVAGSVDLLGKEIERKFAEVENSLLRDGSDLRGALHDARKALSDDLKGVRTEVLDLIQRENSALQAGKVSRTEMSGLLNDLAVRLSDDGAGSD
ncbi:MAG: hypothetical protein HKO62_04585 [Gammaproteobacteria bacterium]|nr:hypothetical protein [Gammaproteobacteria bacterium]NNM00006.1 hypothetical protein [Gammaproteobacteria bacterium]